MHALGPIRFLIAIVAVGFAACGFFLLQTRNALIQLSERLSQLNSSVDHIDDALDELASATAHSQSRAERKNS